MAEHGTTTRFTGPTTPEALFGERQRFWSGFMNATVAAVIFMAVLLIGMAIFL